MTLETFFERFDEFAEASNAIPRIRELLTHLAIAGKLVPNVPSEKAVGLNLSGNPARTSSHPANWRSGLLGEALVFEYGDNLPAPQRSGCGKYPVYGSNGIVGTHDSFLTKAPAIIVGRKGSAGALNIASGPSWTTDVAYYVCPPSDLNLKFTYYLLASLNLDELGKGIKPGLSRKEVYALSVSLPPLAEQKRIVTKVDELMALCGLLEAQLNDRETKRAALSQAALFRFAEAPTPANLELLFYPHHSFLPSSLLPYPSTLPSYTSSYIQPSSFLLSPADLRKTILTLAVQGKLVPQDPNDESVFDVLKREIDAKNLLLARGKMRDERPLEPIKSGEEPSEIPLGWGWCKIDQLVFSLRNDVRTGPFGSSLHKDDHKNAGVPVWGIESIGKDGFFTGRNKIFVNEAKAKELISFSVKGGDIIISRSGTVGELCRLPDKVPAGLISTNLMKISLNHRVVTADYFCLLFRGAISINAQLSALCFGSTRLFLTQKILTKLLFPLPPLAEQRRIVAKVDQLMTLVDKLEAQLASSHSVAEKLMDTAVAELTTAPCP